MDQWMYISDGNLPEEFDEVLLASNKGEMYVGSYRDKGLKYFLLNTRCLYLEYEDSIVIDIMDIVAWCELPCFPKDTDA